MMRPLAEQTIVITGATDGLGRALAGELAAAGAALALHGRDDGKGMATIRDLRQRTGNEKLQWFRADLAALDQVRDLAGRLQSGLDRVDVLVNNARSEEHTSELQSQFHLVCRLLLEKKKQHTFNLYHLIKKKKNNFE